jgi:hypothetical protein
MKIKWFLIGLGFAAILLVVYRFTGLNSDLSASKPFTRNTFKEYKCTQDCSGHEAGYAWAEKKGIMDPDDCGGNSQSFIEGCRAYAEENN